MGKVFVSFLTTSPCSHLLMGIVIITTRLRIATQIKRDNACWAWCLACSKGYEMLVVIMIIKHKLCEQPELSCIAGSNAKNDTATRGNVYQFLIKLHTDSSHNPAIPLLGIYPSEMKTYAHKNLHMSVYSSFIHNWQNLKTTKMSLSRWMNKLWYIQTMKYFSALKRN